MSSARKYTAEDFLEYENQVRHWMHRLGLERSWYIECEQRQLSEASHARVSYNTANRNATFGLSLNVEAGIGADATVEELALHEVLHVLLADLVATLVETKSDESPSAIAREHELLCRLERVLLEQGEGT